VPLANLVATGDSSPESSHYGAIGRAGDGGRRVVTERFDGGRRGRTAMKTTTRSLAVEELEGAVVDDDDEGAGGGGDDDEDDDASFDLDAVREGKPTWFDGTAFEREDFDPWAYVEEVTSFVDEETLRETLERFEEETRGELEAIVNENYEEFASLGDDLEDYEALRARIEPGMRQSRDAATEERDRIVRALESLEASEEKREAQSRASASKQLADECAHTLSKVERLLSELDISEYVSVGASVDTTAPTGDGSAGVVISADDRKGLELLEPAFEDEQATVSGSDVTKPDEMHRSHVNDDVDERASLLDRISSEVNKLNFYQNQGKDLAAVRDLASRIEYCELKLTSLVQTALVTGLKENSSNVISHCLHACTSLGKNDVMESAIRTVLVHPAVEKSLKSMGVEGDFASVLPKVATVALESIANILKISRDSDSGLRSHDFIAGTVLAEVDAQLSASHQNAYSPGIPAIFIKNYRVAMEFINRLEDSEPTVSALNHFYASKHLEVFMRRWNLHAYFSLRSQELAGVVDTDLHKPGLDTSLASDGFLLTATTQIWLTTKKCMSDDFFVPALADKFIRLFAQVLSRYRTWVNGGIESLSLQYNTEEKVEDSSNIMSGTSSWGATAGGDELILVRLDIEKLCERIRTEGIKWIQESTSILGSDTMNAAIDCVLLGVGDLEATISPINSFIVKVHVQRCVDVLKQLKGITATFRMTNKPMPTRHSHFVPTILNALQTFLDHEHAAMFSDAARKEIVAQVVESVTSRYAELASDLVATVKKTEASLNRLKDRQGKSSSVGVGDVEKICRQVQLDAKEYAVHMEKFGIVPKESAAYQALLNAVGASSETQEH